MAITSRQTGSLAAENWKKLYQTFREADFTSYDFETLRKSMIDYIKLNYAEDFNDFTESSEFIALIDLIAFLGQSLAFRTDLNARENFIDTAERRDSILKLARLINYSPKRTLPASGYLKVDSVSTTQRVYDSDGLDLSNRVILWNDASNENWLEQFVSIVNAGLLSNQQFGKPANSLSINNIKTDEYGINLTADTIPVYRFSSEVNGIRMNFEAVSASSTGKSVIYEPAPDINRAFNILYRNDGNGNGSNNTGFFFYFKQGELSNLDFAIDEMIPNKVVDIDVNNINNSDLWLYSLDSQGFTNELWREVPATNGINVIYNSYSEKNLYQVNTRINDQVSLVFGDGTFSNIPQGQFRLYYRTSNGLTYKITPDEMRGIEISIDYVSRDNRVETLTFRVSLRYTVANASAKETADEIKQRAPQQYYTQNRMVTGEDYNILPYTLFSDVRKVKAINRISSGLSRYLDTIDTTGKYSSTNIFGEDGVLYTENSIETINFGFTNQTDIRKFIRNTLIPDVIANKEVLHFFYENLESRLLPNPPILESQMQPSVFYQIESPGTSNFIEYGASSNAVGHVFFSTKGGIKTRIFDVTAEDSFSYRFVGDVNGLNPNIDCRVGDTLIFNISAYTSTNSTLTVNDLTDNDTIQAYQVVFYPFHIKTNALGGTSGNVALGLISNNGTAVGQVVWETAGVPPGTYYYVARNRGFDTCYDIDNFVSDYRGLYDSVEYKARAQQIIPYYTSNTQYEIAAGVYVYGLFRYPGVSELNIWVTYSFVNGILPTSDAFRANFFNSFPVGSVDFQRSRTAAKLLDPTTVSGCGFRDQPASMVGRINLRGFGTGTLKTETIWQQAGVSNGTSSGHFSYNGSPVNIGASSIDYKDLNQGALIKFVPELGYHFNSNMNMVPGPARKADDLMERYSTITRIFGDGTNNGIGNYSNGTGPVYLNLPIPTGAIVESILPAYKNTLNDGLVDIIVNYINNYQTFALNFDPITQNWTFVTPDNSITSKTWIVKFNFDTTTNLYTVSYKSLRYVFYSPKETNFFFDSSLQVYDSAINETINDHIKILRTNGTPEYIGQNLTQDYKWFIHKGIERTDGYIEKKSIYLTYADTNQDSVPDVPHIFDAVVLGGPFRTTRPGLQNQKTATRINYMFRLSVGRYPTQVELDTFVGFIEQQQYNFTTLGTYFNSLQESKDYKNGIFTARELVFFQRTRSSTDDYDVYTLLDNKSVISSYRTYLEISQDIKNFNVGQIFFARNENQFYQIVLNNNYQKVVSTGLNSDLTGTMPEYVAHAGRQNLFYQYRHNSPSTNRIDPTISNIIDIYVLTKDYESAYRLWLADVTNTISEPQAPTTLELALRYNELENYKSISDTIVLQSAKYKPLFGTKASSRMQATFKVVKNPSLNISDADVKTSVISAINDYFISENWDFGETFYFSELAAYLHKMLIPNIASIIITPKNSNMSFGSLYQINSEPYELLISAATVDDIEIVTALTALELQPS